MTHGYSTRATYVPSWAGCRWVAVWRCGRHGSQNRYVSRPLTDTSVGVRSSAPGVPTKAELLEAGLGQAIPSTLWYHFYDTRAGAAC
jgi:hypothetical protein